MKTAELTGAALDWAVAECECALRNWPNYTVIPPYSTDWSQGGPLVEREIQSLIKARIDANTVEWEACNWNDDYGYGPTPLIAAMRTYVASKLGDEVEIPEELK